MSEHNTNLSMPSAAAGSKDSCHKQQIAQYWSWGLVFDFKALIKLPVS